MQAGSGAQRQHIAAQGIAGRALVISAGIIANIVFAYSILLAQVPTVLNESAPSSAWATHLIG